MVNAEGVAMMLLFVSVRIARTMAAKLSPEAARRPTPRVVPWSSVVLTFAGFCAAPARSTMLVPPIGLTKAPIGTLVLPAP